MDNRENPIGLFDSGIGGFTVLKELKKILPNENYIYLADLMNSPYGEKTGEEIFNFSKKNIEFLIKKGAKLIVFACNTASSFNVEKLRTIYNVPIITVIDSAINAIDGEYENILLAATSATVKASVYKDKIKNKITYTNFYSEACVKIASIIEENNLNPDQIQDVVDSYILKYREKNIDLLILGCTHYPIWSDYFKNSIGEKTKIVDPAIQVAIDSKNFLLNNNLENLGNIGITHYYTTAKIQKFNENIDKFIEKTDKENVSLVKL